MGRWSTFDTVLSINYHPHVKILGFTFWGFIAKSVNYIWARLTERVRMQARNAFPRDLCLAHRLRYIHTYILAKIWYIAQIFTARGIYTQRMSVVTYFIYKGATFRVPVSTVQKPKHMEEWELVDIAAKCIALLLSRMHLQSAHEGTTTASWIKEWNLSGTLANPPLPKL